MMRRALLLLALVLASLLVSCEDTDARTVVLWHAYRGDEELAIEDVAQAFERAHPGVRVELLSVPFEAYLSKLESAAPRGHGPDVFIDAHTRLGAYEETKVVAKLPSGVLDEHAYDATSIAAAAGYGVPLSTKCVALYTNTALLPEAPRALSDLEHAKLAPGDYPLAYEADVAYYHAALLSAFGGRILDDAGNYTFDSDAGVASLELLRRLSREHVIPDEPNGSLVTQLFVSGRAAAVIGGPWLRADLGTHVHYRVTSLPVVDGAGPMRPLLTVEAAMLTPRGEKSELAIDLVRFLGSRDAALTLATVGHQVVARNDAWTDPRLDGDPALVAFHEAARTAVATPTSARMQSAWVPTDEAIKKVLRGGDPRAALAESHARFDDAVKPPPPPASPTPALVLLGALLLFASWRIVKNTRISDVRASASAYRYTAHAFVVVIVLVVLPLGAGAATSLFAGTRDAPRYVGFANYVAILTARGGALLGHGSFYLTLLVTVLWTLLNVFFHVTIGVLLGVLLSRPAMKLRAAYRALLVLPWAVPSYVTALAWKGMFHRQFGAVNALLSFVGAEPISWFSKFSTALTANVTTNVWLGFPFMMVVTLGALTSIPKEVLEAAEVDGCTRAQRFFRVTLPLLRPALLPAVVLGAIWTFNMFNVVFLVSGGEPDGTTDILVSDAYRWAFTRDAQYGYAAAYAVLIFGLLWLMTRASSKIAERAS
ncbi:MAG TPA: extracellular solute-binding protein [Polyangiaceae bacterium]|jgi:arabinogalactan oligomer/maltooligosaccharide transport system permease protein